MKAVTLHHGRFDGAQINVYRGVEVVRIAAAIKTKAGESVTYRYRVCSQPDRYVYDGVEVQDESNQPHCDQSTDPDLR